MCEPKARASTTIAITEVLRHIAVKALDHGGAGGLIGAHHLAVVFWVELTGEGRGIGQIAEQHGELTAFGLGGTSAGR